VLSLNPLIKNLVKKTETKESIVGLSMSLSMSKLDRV